MQKIKKLISRLGWPLLFVLAVGSSFVVGTLVGYEKETAAKDISNIDLAPFWQVWRVIDDKFIGQGATTTDEMRVRGAIAGLVDSLGDPYTIFLPPTEKKNFEENITGNFGGVGIEIDLRHRVLTVVSALVGTPAKLVGILPNDQIIKIDDTAAVGLNIDEAVALIRGEIGTEVRLLIAREGETKPLEFKIKRAKIVIPTLETETKDGIFIIKLHNFSANSPTAFRGALREFVTKRGNKMVLDLRGNPGGLLEAAVDLASWFLPAGRTVVTERGKDPNKEKVHRSYGYNIFKRKPKLVVLIDGGSASASEILAGALAEHGLATLVGEKTFGKGSVQELVDLADGSSLKITVAKWFTPKGVSLSDNGLTPEVLVEQKPEDREAGIDRPLARAIEILNGRSVK
ncbi:MAG: S41 family peptidase [Patescibacteria group bacterium]